MILKPYSKECACNANDKAIAFHSAYIYIYIHMYIFIFMKHSFSKQDLRTWHGHCKLDFLNGAYCDLEKSSLCMEENLSKSILNGRFREVECSHGWSFGTQIKAIDIGEWSISGGGRLGRLYGICMYIHSLKPFTVLCTPLEKILNEMFTRLKLHSPITFTSLHYCEITILDRPL